MSKGIKIVKSAEVKNMSWQTGRTPSTRRQRIGWSVLVSAVAIGLALAPALITAQGNETMTITPANGGAVESIRTLSGDAPASIIETDPLAIVPGMAMEVPDVAANGNDLLLIEFSAESRLFFGGPHDSMILHVYVDGVLISPTIGGDFAFTGDDTWSSHSKQFVKKVAAGVRTVHVYWDLLDVFSDDFLNGGLDDYMLTVTRHN